MDSPHLQDVSLYELAFSSEQPPHPLQISPTILKSMMSSVIDLLIEQKIPATLWLKLPKGEVWQAEIDRYRKLAAAPHSIYILHNQRDPIAEPLAEASAEPSAEPLGHPDTTADSAQANLENLLDETDLVGDGGVVLSAVPGRSRHMVMPLAADSRLRREYFLLAIAPEFSVLVLAHRPRSVQSSTEDAEINLPVSSGKKGPAEDELERKHPLLSVFSFDPSTLHQVLEGINRSICCGQSQAEPSPEIEELLVNWDSLVNPALNSAPHPVLLSQLLARQVQRQEELWRSSAAHRKQAETATTLQMGNEELFNMLRLKDEFLKNVGQELRTPLATMKTALTLLNSPNLKPPQRQRYMELLSQECDRQSALITSVLDLVQLDNVVEQTSMQPLRLTDIVPGVVSTYQPLAQEKGLMLAYTIPEDLPAVSCLNTWIRQIVINLLHNSIKFTPKGGQVWVRAKQQGDFVQIEFRDTGIGIPALEITKIFERFYRVRHGAGEDYSGSGLGLSIVQQLLLRCGGSVSVKSKLGEGSVFNVLLPIYHS